MLGAVWPPICTGGWPKGSLPLISGLSLPKAPPYIVSA